MMGLASWTSLILIIVPVWVATRAKTASTVSFGNRQQQEDANYLLFVGVCSVFSRLLHTGCSLAESSCSETKNIKSKQTPPSQDYCTIDASQKVLDSQSQG